MITFGLTLAFKILSSKKKKKQLKILIAINVLEDFKNKTSQISPTTFIVYHMIPNL